MSWSVLWLTLEKPLTNVLNDLLFERIELHLLTKTHRLRPRKVVPRSPSIPTTESGLKRHSLILKAQFFAARTIATQVVIPPKIQPIAKATTAIDTQRIKSFSRPSSISMIDGDLSAGAFCSATGAVEVEFSCFWVGLGVGADAKTAVLSVAVFFSEDASRDSSHRSAKQTRTTVRKTWLTPTIN